MDAATGPSYSVCALDGGSPVDQPGDQARRVSTDTVRLQGCCSASCDTATGPSVSDCVEDRESPTGAVHMPSSGRASCGAATGLSASNCRENSGSTADAVRRHSCGPVVTTRQLEADVACLLRRLGAR